MKDANKILIFIPACNAEKTIKNVLSRIPAAICNQHYEILIIDDQSTDHTFDIAADYQSRKQEIHLTVLSNPEKQGYGRSQKLGFRYAIDKGFAVVALLPGDGQCAPEALEELLLPVLNGEADAVFATRMARGLKPLSPFYSGYGVYTVKALEQIPFELNTDDFHFNAEMAIQLKLNESTIREIPVPTCPGTEKCHVNRFAYAWNVMKATRRARLHQMNISYHRQFDMVNPKHWYPPKFDFLSSHTMAINEVRPGAHVLDIGCGPGHVGRELEKRNCQVTGVDIATEEDNRSLQKFSKIDLNSASIPFPPDSFDTILILDVLEHLDLPAQFNLLEKIRSGSKSKKPMVIITVPNIAFLFIRLQLLMGKFNYGKRGILDMTHRHLFTFKSIRRVLRQAGYKIEKTKGIPPPYPQVIGYNVIARLLLKLNACMIRLIPGLFSYQIFIKATPLSTATQLLQLADEKSQARELPNKK